MDTMTLRDILTWPVVTTTPDQPVSAGLDVMRTRRISALVVVEGERPVGIFTERDAVLIAYHHRNPETVRVGEVMGKPPLTALLDMDYREAHQLMCDRGVRHLIVVNAEGRLAGIVSENDFLDHLGFEYLVRFKEVGAVMTRQVFTLREDAVAKTAIQLMARHRISCIVVERNDRPVGIITERDVVRLARDNVNTVVTPLSDIMSAPVQAVSANDALDATSRRMNESGIRRLVVVDADGRIAGLVTRHDLTNALYSRHIEHLRETIVSLREELAREPDRLFRHLVDHSADAVIVADARSGRIVETSQEACDFLGYAREELLAMQVPDISDFFKTTSWEQQAERIRRQGRLVLQTDHRRKDGSRVPTEVGLRYVPGEPHDYVVGILRDISERRRAEGALAEREAQLSTLIEAVPDSVQFKDGEGGWRLANSISLRTFGLEDKEWQGLSDARIAARYPELSDALAGCIASDEAAWAAGGLHRTEESLLDRAGQPVYWDVIKVPLFNDDGSRRALVIVSRDITPYRRAEEGLRLAASVFQSSREGIAISDAKAKILDVNEAFCRITGYARDEVIGQSPRILKSGLHDDSFYETMWQAIVGRGFWSGEIWNRRKDGSLYPELLTITSVRNPAGETTQYVGIFTDITVLKQHEKQLEQVAHYDALTGIPNRVLLADRMQQAIAQTKRDGKSMALGYLDLDGFKPINDRFGHEAGDRLLVEIAQRLKNALRGTDTVARLGGDEFVFILLGVDRLEEWADTLNRILEAITQPMALAGHSVSISASIGVTLYPEDDNDPDTLLRHADQAMYQAKQGGHNRYHLYDPEHDRRAKSHLEAFTRIKQALTAGEFELHYQPKVNMREGSVIGAEALIRWRHPTHGLMPPGEFLPIIENSELDSAIGEWVLGTALTQMQTWQEMGLDFQISVNISAHHLQQEDFIQRLAETLAAHPTVPPGRLQLEVLETAALEDMAGVSEIMRLCRAKGVSFALDDFGTGYSSLTYLKRLPAETLKIDQSFIRDILEDPEDLAIVQGIIALSKAFGHSVVAEGVETAEHGLMLLRLGCELAQGYGIARPMPAAELPEWVRTWRPDPRWLAA